MLRRASSSALTLALALAAGCFQDAGPGESDGGVTAGATVAAASSGATAMGGGSEGATGGASSSGSTTSPLTGGMTDVGSSSGSAGPTSDPSTTGVATTLASTSDSPSTTGEATEGTKDTEGPSTTIEPSTTGPVDPTEGDPLCQPSPGDTICAGCTKTSCCDQVIACDADDSCGCYLQCLFSGGDATECKVMCNSDGVAIDALVGCMDDSCPC